MGWVTLNLRTMEDKVLHNNYQKDLLDISRRRQQVARNKSYQSLLINNERKSKIADLKKTKEHGYDDYQKAYDKYTQLKKAYDKAKSDSQTYQAKANRSNKTVMYDDNLNPIYEGNNLRDCEPAYLENGQYTQTNQGNGTQVFGYWLGSTYKEVPLDHVITAAKSYQDGSSKEIPVLTDSQLDKLKAQVDAAENEKTSLYTAYNKATTDFEESKNSLNDLYDQELQTLEEETTAEENSIDLEQTQLEAQLESITQEMQSAKQQVSQDMQSVVIKLG